jgi:two-component system, chemotaxis family, sensor kinase CheA
MFTMVDIHAKVLAAFQVESKEYLESIRSLMTDLDKGVGPTGPQRIDEAFRLAHSLKGGARVCDLKQAEVLGHRLEHVFECLQHGQLPLQNDVIVTINSILDAIEDCMAAVAGGQPLPAIDDTLQRVERLLHEPVALVPTQDPEAALNAKLLESFQREYCRYAEQLRGAIAGLSAAVGERPERVLFEAARMAHNLVAAAQAAGLSAVEPLGKRLESTFAGLAAGMVDRTSAIAGNLSELLNGIENRIGLAAPAPTFRESAPAPQPADPSPSQENPDEEALETADDARLASDGEDIALNPPVPVGHGTVRAASAADTVRVAASTLDHLLLISRQLASECMRQQDVTRELRELRRQVQRVLASRDAFRFSATGSLHEIAQNPRFTSLLHHLDGLDEQILGLARHIRHLDTRHQQNSWMFSSRIGRLRKGIHLARLTPVDDVLQGFRKMVRDLAKDQHKRVDFEVRGGNSCADRLVLQALRDPLMHMLRNCVIHGIETTAERLAAGKAETGRVILRVETLGNRLTIEVEDDGRGLSLDRIRQSALRQGLIDENERTSQSPEALSQLVFRSGFSTYDGATEIAGRGMGLSVVQETVSRLQGEVHVAAPTGQGSLFRLIVPLSISSHRLLLVSCGTQTYGIPLHAIERLLRYRPEELATVEGKPVLTYQGRPMALLGLQRLLGLDERSPPATNNFRCAVILRFGSRRAAVAVDGFLGERDALVHDLDDAAARAPFAGAIALEDGRVTLVINPAELLSRVVNCQQASRFQVADSLAEPATPRVLVVDDSFTTRTLEKSILEAHGYDVSIAVDGVEALSQLRRDDIDLVISDIEMPRMDGFALLEEMKHDQRLAHLPVILVTSRDQPEDEQRGMALGADAYIVKRKFDHQELLGTIHQMLESHVVHHGLPVQRVPL